ncbi:Aste57867_1557 [Aphanomyces stellatus]|uniref:Aste57867_1557 protein n=1 Tax=Aphanomyces stellatus TaxID=120398 RepID=A0A485K5J8_9STRA|nr:hypothetical protein As57867_001556 [Aphanomyces stellatus]VFT78771.1 Aste57867_1557 [Aphanomyces stellatus]
METLLESALTRYSPQEILCFSFLVVFVLTLAFVYVVVDPTLPKNHQLYKHLSLAASRDAQEEDATSAKAEQDREIEALIERTSLREIDREIDAAVRQDIRRRRPRGDGAIDDDRVTSVSLADNLMQQKHDDYNCPHCLTALVECLKTGKFLALKRPLQCMLDTLTFYKAPATRDINKTSIFCKALVKLDGLDLLRSLSEMGAVDAETRAMAQSLIEQAVPSIWN